MPSKIILERDAAAAAAAADILSRYQGESRSREAVCISYMGLYASHIHILKPFGKGLIQYNYIKKRVSIAINAIMMNRNKCLTHY